MITEFLNWLNRVFGSDPTPLHYSRYLYLDYWTLIHFFSGVFLMVFLIRTMKGFDWRKRFSVLFILLAFWEVFEGNFSGISAEPAVDIIYDLVVGVTGGFFIYYYNVRVSKR